VFEKIVEMRLTDTTKIQSFTKNFASIYFGWSPNKEALEIREEKLTQYLSEELQQLNTEMIRVDIPTTSVVQEVQFWEISENEEGNYHVVFSVKQLLSEGDTKKQVVSCYRILVHVDEVGDMVIIQNPTINKIPEKADYEPSKIESDGSVDSSTVESIQEFLETFFALYPSADEKELAYYVKGGTLPAIHKDFIFVELMNPVYRTIDKQIHVNVIVKYLDNETKTTHLAQYHLVVEKLEKNDNWQIVEMR
jgi:hypothetical protein